MNLKMKGTVDDAGRALLRVQLKNTLDAKVIDMDVWIDTGFTGELVVPQTTIDSLGLARGAEIKATLGDGSVAHLNTYTCLLEWFGEWKPIEIIANQGRIPLLGVGLLLDRMLQIDYRTKMLSIQ